MRSESTKKTKRGLGSDKITPERRREICALGGKTAHANGTAHEFTTAEAQAAGRKGGEIVSSDRAHMARIGRLGALARVRNRKAAQS
jgi:general stress protein YciG